MATNLRDNARRQGQVLIRRNNLAKQNNEGPASRIRPVRRPSMPKDRKPRQRKPDDYRNAAEDSLEAAKVLAGQGRISDQDFLERLARSDELVDHDGKTCGMCHNLILGAQVAREMIQAGAYEDVGGK